MKLSERIARRWFYQKNLSYKLNLIFGLFFFFPVIGFLYFSVKYKMLQDEYIPFFFLGVLIFSLTGFTILKSLFDRIVSIAEELRDHGIIDKAQGSPGAGAESLSIASSGVCRDAVQPRRASRRCASDCRP